MRVSSSKGVGMCRNRLKGKSGYDPESHSNQYDPKDDEGDTINLVFADNGGIAYFG